jgi:hypothetical protein
MSEWQITHKPAYDADFIDLNKNLQQAAVAAVHELAEDPITPRGIPSKRCRGIPTSTATGWGIFASYTPICAPGPHGPTAGHRPPRSVYERFDFPGWDAPDTAVEFGPELAAQPEWMNHPEWFRPPPEPEKERLPRKLTPSLLKQMANRPPYHEPLMRCLYEDDLVQIPENKVPA